jgi:PHD/YefM family antitoxin component YafN of YafNO toxin-antitoxin module
MAAVAKMANPFERSHTMHITATEAKNRFGYVCAQAKAAPVVVEKEGRPDSVILSFVDFQALTLAAKATSLAQKRKEFNDNYKDWIALQNADFEQNGLWCEGLVAWESHL